jgi:hypothetical protein
MGENAASKYREEDLADDVIFEPSSSFEGRRVGVAIKDGIQVCWSCFTPLSPVNQIDAMLGQGIVRLCLGDADCRGRAGKKNREINDAIDKGEIILTHQLPEKDRLRLLAESKEKRKKKLHEDG